MTSVIEKIYSTLILKFPVVTILSLVLILSGVGLGIKDFKLDATTDALLLESDADLRSFREMGMRYKTREFLFVAVEPNSDIVSKENIDFIKRLRDDLANVPQVYDVISMLDIPLVNNVQGSLAEVATNFQTLRMESVDVVKAREELTESPVYRDLIASADGSVTAMQIFLNPHPELPRLRKIRDELLFNKHSDQGLTEAQNQELTKLEPDYQSAKATAESSAHEAIASIRAILERYEAEDSAKLYLGGLPMITDDLITFIGNDLVTFGAGVFAFLIIMLTLIFREARWVVLPFASCIYSGTFMLGLLGHLGWKVTIISSNFLALMLIITMSMNIHLVVRYRELFRDQPNASQSELVLMTIKHMLKPCFYTAITTIIAFSSLIISGIRPVIDFGLMMTIGLIVVFLTSFSLFPALLVMTKKRVLRTGDSINYPLTVKLGKLTEKYGKAVLVISMVLGVLGITGMQKLEVENSFISYFHEDTEIHQGLRLIDEKLGGTTPLDIILKFPDTFEQSEYGMMDDDLAALFGEVSGEIDKADSWFTYHKVDRIKAVHDYLDSRPEIGKVLSAGGMSVLFTLFFIDFFDTAGTLTSVANVAGKVDSKGKVQDIEKAMLADSVGTVAGALVGTSTVTSYVESGAGVKAGGRTGMTSLVIGVLFLLCLGFAPLATSLPKEIDGAALVYVAVLFVRNIVDIEWDDIVESAPAVLCMTVSECWRQLEGYEL